MHRSEEEMLKYLYEQEQTGLTVKEYCEMYDIVEQTFYGWVKRYRARVDKKPPMKYRKVKIMYKTVALRKLQDKPKGNLFTA